MCGGRTGSGEQKSRDLTPPCFAMAAAGLSLLTFSLLLFFFAASCAAQADSPRFRCSATGSGSTCQALAGYITGNDTTYDAIRTLFQVDSIRDLYRFNNLSTSTPASTRVPAGVLVRVPFPCSCTGGVGVADSRPVYVVAAGDILFNIATVNFQGLLNYRQIVAANSIIIKNESKIENGWRLRIPLPCSCDAVGGAEAVHLAYVVAKGDSLERIAAQFGTTSEILSRINNISDPKSLEAGQVLDVPLQGSASPPAPSTPPRSGAHALRPQLWSWTQSLLGVAAPLYSALLLLA